MSSSAPDILSDETPRAVHVLDAPSPAATASIAAGRAIAAKAERHLG